VLGFFHIAKEDREVDDAGHVGLGEFDASGVTEGHVKASL
jgi:hypothetical protein